MPEAIRAQPNNYKIVQDASGRTIVTEEIYITDCDGATPLLKLLDAFRAPGIPAMYETNELNLFCNHREVKPSEISNVDAIIVCIWTPDPPPSGGGGGGSVPLQEGGVVLQQVQTEFSGPDRKKPIGQRTPLTISYQAEEDEEPKTQGATINAFIQKPTRVFRRPETTDPFLKAKNFVGTRNAGPFGGAEAGAGLLLSLTWTTVDNKVFYCTYEAGFDFDDHWNQIIRYRDPTTGLVPANVELGNGIEEVQAQSDADWNELALL